MKEMGLQPCKTDLCVWKPVSETSWRLPSQVLALFHIEWLHTKSKWMGTRTYAHEGYRRVTTRGPKLLDGCESLRGQRRPGRNQIRETQNARNITDKSRNIHVERSRRSDALACTQTDAKRARVESMLQSSLPTVTVGTLMKSNRVLKEIKV